LIPSGKVTFLFTDIEGSTKLAQKNANLYLSSLDKHHEILYEIIDSNNGFVFKIVGDSFCCAFSNPEEAVNAAIKTQIRLNATDWGGSVIKVRMGIHSGEAEFVNQDYSGYVTLSRSQRIMSVAHGGQILITQEVYESVKDSTENNFSFRDFGERKMKDILLPEHVYQIVSDKISSEFPPLKSQDARQNNLPSSLTEFIGRRKEINEIKQLFPKIRLLSLIGAGGTGKTRLAIQLVSEVIDEFDNGVWIIELSPVTDPELVVKEISSVLNLKEDPGTELLETLKEFLKDKKILLLFDNSEHLLNKCAQISETLLSYCPGLKIISTSREPFNSQGETLYRIPPLSMPDKIKNESFETLSGYESVKFFLERATSINPKFSLTNENIYTVAEICKKLDGIPLAIELAAKRVNVLSAEQILERLNDRFKLLTGGSATALPRQKTLKALIDWSYDMLGPGEQQLLQRLSIFMGGWTLEAAEEICSDETIDQYEVLDLMTGLHDKSLITFNETNGNGRYGILESIKYYALEKLENNTEDFQRHLEYFLNLSSYPKQKLKKLGQLQWLNIIEPELDNIRSNIQWATDNNQDEAVRLVINTFDFWLNKGYLQEGYDSSVKVLDTINPGDNKLKADLLYRIARFCYEIGKFNELEKFSSEALDLYREINDKEGIVKALNTLGLKYYTEMDYNNASKLNEEALSISNEINSKEDKANSLYNLSFPVVSLGDFVRSIALKEEALKISREIKNEHLIARLLLSLSVTYSRKTGDIRKAELYSEESLKISRKLNDNYLISVNLVHLADLKLYYENKNYDEAEYILLEAYKISKDCGYNMNLFPIWNHLGGLYTETEKYVQAVKIYNEYIQERDKPGGEFFMPDVISGFVKIYFKRNDYGNAAKLTGFLEPFLKQAKRKPINKNLSLSDEDKKKILEELGEEKYNLCRIEGESMKPDEAAVFCLENELG
jgi:predicted ATPase/class 3 adenylate cyclase